MKDSNLNCSLENKEKIFLLIDKALTGMDSSHKIIQVWTPYYTKKRYVWQSKLPTYLLKNNVENFEKRDFDEYYGGREGWFEFPDKTRIRITYNVNKELIDDGKVNIITKRFILPNKQREYEYELYENILTYKIKFGSLSFEITKEKFDEIISKMVKYNEQYEINKDTINLNQKLSEYGK